MHKVEAQHRETERLRAELAKRRPESDFADMEAHTRSLQAALSKQEEALEAVQSEYQERITYLEGELRKAEKVRTTLHQTRQSEQSSMKQVCRRCTLCRRCFTMSTFQLSIKKHNQALEESRQKITAASQLKIDNEVPPFFHFAFCVFFF